MSLSRFDGLPDSSTIFTDRGVASLRKHISLGIILKNATYCDVYLEKWVIGEAARVA
jgi:hypothetical protein